MSRLRRRTFTRLLIFLTAAGAVGILTFGGQRQERFALPAVEADEAAALCARTGYPIADFWERAAAMGVRAVILRQTPISILAQRGEILRFSREEFEKWKAAGFISPGIPLKPDTFWMRDQRKFSQLTQAALRLGMAVSTSAMSGYYLLQFPEGVMAAVAEDSTLGIYDPDTLQQLAGRSLLPVYAAGSKQKVRTVGVRRSAGFSKVEGGLAVYSVPMATAAAEGWRDETEGGLPDDWILEAKTLAVDAEPSVLLRGVYSHPRRLLIFHLAASRGAEGNFDLLRGAIRELNTRSISTELPPRPSPSSASVQGGLIRLLLWLFAVLGPLFTARAGLLALKRTRALVRERLPVGSPVAQLAAGMVAAGSVAVALALAVRTGFDALAIPVPDSTWTYWTTLGPLILGLLSLYTINFEPWLKKLASPITYADALKIAALAAAALLLLRPRFILGGILGYPGLIEASNLPFALWWLPWRWREILVGFPCLLQAFFLVNWRMDCPDCEALDKGPLKDPRGWFLLGLLAPIGIIGAFSRGGLPRELALLHTLYALPLGCALGALLIAVRLRWASALSVNKSVPQPPTF